GQGARPREADLGAGDHARPGGGVSAGALDRRVHTTRAPRARRVRDHGRAVRAEGRRDQAQGLRARARCALEERAGRTRLLGPGDRDTRARGRAGLSASPEVMLANRLRKRAKHLAKWARREAVSCYRLYDCDIPEVPLTIDQYEAYLHISAYAREG